MDVSRLKICNLCTPPFGMAHLMRIPVPNAIRAPGLHGPLLVNNICSQVFPIISQVFPIVAQAFPIFSQVFPICSQVFPICSQAFPFFSQVFPFRSRLRKRIFNKDPALWLPPGGNQVDGLPPVFHFEKFLNERGTTNEERQNDVRRTKNNERITTSEK